MNRLVSRIFVSKYLSIIVLLLASCREFYEPEIITQDFGFLVAEGYVELEGKSTLKLGRTVTVYSEQSINPINNATVFLTGSESGSWQFALEEDGT
ncbi:DUF4249 family protein, partial [Litoribacter alkaliphilus]|nr:DUF4249 family protein [Litoribacter alkaliphilus]